MMSAVKILSERGERRVGKRAAKYVREHSITARDGALLVADMHEIPDGVARTLTRLYGRPTTIDRGEVAYWAIYGSDIKDYTDDS